MDTLTRESIDVAIALGALPDERRQVLRYVLSVVDESQRFASSIFAALECATESQRAALKIALPEFVAAWEEFKIGGLEALALHEGSRR